MNVCMYIYLSTSMDVYFYIFSLVNTYVYWYVYLFKFIFTTAEERNGEDEGAEEVDTGEGGGKDESDKLGMAQVFDLVNKQTHTHTHTHKRMCTCTHTQTHTHAYAPASTRTHAQTNANSHTRKSTCALERSTFRRTSLAGCNSEQSYYLT